MKHLTQLILFFLLPLSIFSQEKMALIPSGTYMMGKDSKQGADFSPAHKVSVDSFYIDVHEVTNSEYYKFCKETGHRLPEFWNMDIFHSGENYPDHPVVGVSWFDARKYAKWAGKRLPTEAEWEYAARGGLHNNEFPNGNEWLVPLRRNDSVGNWVNLTVEVASFEPNAYGLYDMGGNVWEWVADRYSETYYSVSEHHNPKGPESGSNRVIRSGSWHSGKMCKKVYFRKGLISSWCDFAVGFRCVKDVE